MDPYMENDHGDLGSVAIFFAEIACALVVAGLLVLLALAL